MQTFRILVVEDEPSIRNLIDDFLASEGFDTVVARDGREAVDIAANVYPDIVLMDMMLPVLDGASAIRQIRSILGARHPRVIAMSADARALRDAQALEVDGVLAKPFNLSELLNLISSHALSARESR